MAAVVASKANGAAAATYFAFTAVVALCSVVVITFLGHEPFHYAAATTTIDFA